LTTNFQLTRGHRVLDVDDRIPIDAATTERWAGLALSIRAIGEVLRLHTVPDEGTEFWKVEQQFPGEAISQWCGLGIRSSVDHLRVWADFAVPLAQYEGQTVEHVGFRWYFTLIRAALEGAAQSLWLSQAKTDREAMARHIRMIRHDLEEQRKAWNAMGRSTADIDSRLEKWEYAAGEFAGFGPDVKALPSMVDLIRSSAMGCGLDAGLYEGHWRTASAAAHSKDWAVVELQIFAEDRRESSEGYVQTHSRVDPAKLTEALSDAVDLARNALVTYLMRSYAGDVLEISRSALLAAGRMTPQTDGGEGLERFAEENGVKL
jgi:hypothetical protein